MRSTIPSNHKKRWTSAEQEKLCNSAKEAQQKDQTPFDFCYAVAASYNRKADAIFLQLANQGLLDDNIKWYSNFNRDWQNGQYKTTSWANMKQENPTKRKKPVNQDNSSLPSENGESSCLKLEPFKYSESEEQELSRFFHNAFDHEQLAPWCGVENGPTGLGKTHYMTQEIIADYLMTTNLLKSVTCIQYFHWLFITWYWELILSLNFSKILELWLKK